LKTINRKVEKNKKHQKISVNDGSNDDYRNDYRNYNRDDYSQGSRPNSTSREYAGQHYHYTYNYKKLYKSTRDKWLGGVCGGIAEHFNKDPVLIRVLWVLMTVISAGVGIIAYLLFWLVLDKYPSSYPSLGHYGRKVHYHYHYR
jgi:phage shock protein C